MNITDVDDQAAAVLNYYFQEFQLVWVKALAKAAQVEILRISNLRLKFSK